MMQNRWLRCLCVILSVSFVLTLAPSRISAEDDIVNFYSVSENLEYDVDVTIVSAWDTYANLEFTITNTGTETIHNWYFTFDLPYIVEGIWNAYVFETVNGVFTIKNAGWNQDIQANSTVNFGMTVSSLNGQPIDALPSFYLLNITERTVDPSCYALSYQEYSNWGSGFNGALVITNISAETIEDWSLFFSTNREITEVSGADLDTDDNIYHVSNNDSNQNLAPYSNVNLTVNGSGLDTNNTLVLNSVALKAVSCAFGLTEDVDSNGIVDYVDFINGKNTDPDISPTPTPTVTPTDDPSITPTPDVSLTPSITPEPTVEPTPVITPTPEPTDIPEEDFSDSDEDGLLDSEERMYGTDPNLPDSDGDGITDFIEISMGYNPCQRETDGDGISDGDKDFDMDGISNAEEIKRGICPFLSDSDDDNINDYDEIYAYGTLPDNDDTDEDNLIDGDEVALGLDPTNPDSDGDNTPDDQEKIRQTTEKTLIDDTNTVISSVDVSVNGTGYIESNLSISNTLGIDVYSSALGGLVGSPVTFEYSGEMDEATMVFHYIESELDGVDEEDLCLIWYDEENGEYDLLDEQMLNTNENTITYTTTHFSTYMIVNKPLMLLKWKETLDRAADALQRNETQYLIAVYLDYRDSTEERILKNNIVHTISGNLTDDSYMALLFFSEECESHVGLSRNEFDSQSDYRVLYTDIDFSDNPDYTNMFSFASDAQIVCSSNLVLYLITSESEISLTDEDWEEINRNGTYEIRIISTSSSCQVADSVGTEIETICYSDESDEFFEAITLSSKFPCRLNSDSDEFLDYQERCGFVLTNATYITTNPQKGDTDDDTLLDSDEIARPKRLLDLAIARDPAFKNLFAQYVGIIDYCWIFNSNPTMKDSDGDKAEDSEDARPLQVNPNKIYVFTSKEFARHGQVLGNTYEINGYLVEVFSVDSMQEFTDAWNQIGLCASSESISDRLFYNVTDVVIQMHGTRDSLEIAPDTFLCTEFHNLGITHKKIKDLPNKRIESIELNCCNTGRSPNSPTGKNVAEEFLEFSDCVVAPDTMLTYVYVNENTDYMSYSYYCWTYDEYKKIEVNDESEVKGKEINLNNYSNSSETHGFLKYTQPIDKDINTTDCYFCDTRLAQLYYCRETNKYFLDCEIVDDYDFNNLHDTLLSMKAGEF